jgi:stage II sporulation protein D
MKIAVITAACSLLFLFSLPLILVKSEPVLPEQMEPAEEYPAETANEAPPAQEERAPYTADADTTISLLCDGQIREITMDKYLWGVAAAEMPASFEPEALKAQVVASRTYALWKIAAGTCDRHRTCSLRDSGCPRLTNPRRWRKNGDQRSICEKIREAVAHDGKVVLYGKVIEALYHSSASGYTEDALAVWGSDVPYLRSVVSPEDSASVPNYYSVQRIPADHFREQFLGAYPSADLTGSANGWFQNLARSRTGSVISVDVGGVSVRGTELRTLFELRSTAFSPGVDGEDIVFSVIGYGHGVGMSQYGANVLAQSGMDYIQILSWYYTGASVSDYTAKQGL